MVKNMLVEAKAAKEGLQHYGKKMKQKYIIAQVM